MNENFFMSYDEMTNMLEKADFDNGNTMHNPESIQLALAEKVMKEYALNDVFEKEIAMAHRNGEIYIHDLGMVNRFYCSGHSPE